jgi:hypothetical protein
MEMGPVADGEAGTRIWILGRAGRAGADGKKEAAAEEEA